MMKQYLFLFFLSSIHFWAQIGTQPSGAIQRDPFFNTKAAAQKETAKVKLIQSQSIKKDANFEGNPYFEGAVIFEHQGSRLFADKVIWYQEQNFVKAIGNVKLLNADGSVITSQEMEYDGNTQKGLAQKNVVLTDPTQTIRTETLYYDRLANKAYFNTGGTITNGQSTIYTKTGTYHINTRTVSLDGNTKIENKDYLLEGVQVVQNQLTNIAEFTGPTTITNKKKPQNKVYTEKGTYHQNSKEVHLFKNSTIFYNGKTLRGNIMYYNQNTQYGNAKGNVILNDPEENRFIKGGYGEIFEQKDSAMVTEKPYVVKILEKDSLYFSAEKIIAYRKLDHSQTAKSYLRAYNASRFFKSNIQARADSLAFDETDGILHLFGKPMAWSGAKQVSGEKIEGYFNVDKEHIDSLKVIDNAFTISKVDSTSIDDEFNQVKGKYITVYYEDNEVKMAKVIGNGQSVAFVDDERRNNNTIEKIRIGVTLSTCGIIEALFEERKMQILSCNVGAQTETYPMSKINHEQRFLPGFNWNTRDRLQKWQDIFEDSPNYPQQKYESINPWLDKAISVKQQKEAQEEAQKPKRQRKE